MQPGSSSANRRRQDRQRWTWDLRQSAPRSIHESHTSASPRHVTECNIRRVRSHVRLWPILGARFVTADGHRGRFGRGFPAKTQPSLPRQAQLRVTSPPGSPSRRVTRPAGAAGQMCAFGEPALRSLLPAGGCLANPRSAPGRAWRAVFDTAAPAQGIECFADREQLGRRNVRGRHCGGHLDKQACGHDIVGCLNEHRQRGDPARQCLPLQHGFQPPAPALNPGGSQQQRDETQDDLSGVTRTVA